MDRYLDIIWQYHICIDSYVHRCGAKDRQNYLSWNEFEYDMFVCFFNIFRSWYVSQSPRSNKVAVCFGLFLLHHFCPSFSKVAVGWGCRYVLLKDYVKSAKVGKRHGSTHLKRDVVGALGGNQWNQFMDIWLRITRWWFQTFLFSPLPMLTNIFEMGWNHQPEYI